MHCILGSVDHSEDLNHHLGEGLVDIFVSHDFLRLRRPNFDIVASTLKAQTSQDHVHLNQAFPPRTIMPVLWQEYMLPDAGSLRVLSAAGVDARSRDHRRVTSGVVDGGPSRGARQHRHQGVCCVCACVCVCFKSRTIPT